MLDNVTVFVRGELFGDAPTSRYDEYKSVETFIFFYWYWCSS